MTFWCVAFGVKTLAVRPRSDGGISSFASDTLASGSAILHAPGMREWISGLRFWPSLGVAATSSVLIGLGAPPQGWIPGEWLGFVPLILMVRRPSVTRRQAFILGWVGGLGIGLVGFPWIAEMLVRFAGLPWVLAWVGLFAFSAWMAIPYGLFGLGLRWGPQRGAGSWAWPVLLFPALMFVWPNLFPYTPLLGFAEYPPLMQAAEWIGVHGLEALVVGWAVCAARLLTGPGSPVLPACVVVLLPLLLVVAGQQRIQTLETRMAASPTLKVGLVQPNVPPGGGTARDRLERLWRVSAKLEEQGAQLLVWPEAGAYPYLLPRSHAQDGDLGDAAVLGRHRLPTLFGAGSRERGAPFGFNSFYFVDPDGAVRGRYDKVNRVPFGEAIPLVDPDWVSEQIPYVRHLYAGAGPEVFEVDLVSSPKTVRVGPLICYEDILPGFVGELAARPGGVELFVNGTIDAWYGYGSEPWEHLALAQFRSVEHRIPLARSTTTGVSAVVDAAGRIQDWLPVRPVEPETLADYPSEGLLVEVALLRNTAANPTPYARWGWFFPYACVGSVFGVVLYSRLGSRFTEES